MTPEFRVWDKETKKMYFVSSIDMKSNGDITVWTNYFEGGYRLTDYVLEQYTGMKDKNGTKIFEGDVVESIDEEWSTGGSITGTVQYLAPQFTFDSAGVGRPGVWKTLDGGCRVIGNIHENPELLGGAR